jgi:hypothetical protein
MKTAVVTVLVALVAAAPAAAHDSALAMRGRARAYIERELDSATAKERLASCFGEAVAHGRRTRPDAGARPFPLEQSGGR